MFGFRKNIGKNLSNKYSESLLDSAKNSVTGAKKKKLIQREQLKKTGEAKGDLIGDRIANKITSASKKYLENAQKTHENEIEIPKERYIFSEKRQQIIDELRLI